ncbi:hypothetical protein ACOSP7_020337 [Xanthoceras sorbifolium]
MKIFQLFSYISKLLATSQVPDLLIPNQIHLHQPLDLHIPNQIHFLQPLSGTHLHNISGLSCSNWQLAVETNNIIGWETVPEECANYTTSYNSTEFNEWAEEGKAPALPESLELYKKLLSLGIKIVFLTGRSEDRRNATTTNLNNVGYHTWEKLILKDSSYSGKTAVAYKSSERKKLKEGSNLIGTNTGNQTFKLPDPMYYIS